MQDKKETFSRAYALVEENRMGKTSAPLPSERLLWYMQNSTAGVFDVADTKGSSPMEFLQMAYYSLIGCLPEEKILANWQEKEKALSDRAFREEVTESLAGLPEVVEKGRVIRNNIYAKQSRGAKKTKKNLKQRVLLLGYRVSRNLPVSVKTPLKKLAMKFLVR